MTSQDIESQCSEYNQSSFVGGMNLLGDDSRLQPNQYRIGFNLTNRDDELAPILESVQDTAIPEGVIQEMTTFGNYEIMFAGGNCFYKLYTATGWNRVIGFKMSSSAPRFWTVAIPVSTTNYLRYAATGSIAATINSAGTIQLSSVLGASGGNLPGLLVQDNINQPMFIFIGPNDIPIARITQTFAQWSITFTDATNTIVALDNNGVPIDNREYVPIGNVMTFNDGILYVTSQDTNSIYRSVSGRPLDFVVNVTNILATVGPPFTQFGGGDATTTSYSVGVNSISCIRALSSGGIFVSASGANFAVTKNTTPNAPTLFGEYTFIRTFLFFAQCLSDRAIIDSLGDTRFIDLTGVRSFNAIEQTQNEGRNTPFTKMVQSAFGSVIQKSSTAAAIIFDNYEIYSVDTIFGQALLKYDTINACWTAFDINQTGGSRVKILTKIELDVQRLYAVTEDNKLYVLYSGIESANAKVRTVGICASMLYMNSDIKMNAPKSEVKPNNFRVISNKITSTGTITFTPYVNNRVAGASITKTINYRTPINPSSDPNALPDVNTQLNNILFNIPNCGQGWKCFGILEWNTGVITQYSMDLSNMTPINPTLSQGVIV